MQAIHIGCSGWDYADWRGTFYDQREPKRRWLELYATHFDTVEVNSTFYRLARAEAVRRWVEATPDGFRFAEIGKELHRPLVDSAAALGQAHAARRAVEKPRLQMRLELGHLPRGGGGRKAEPLRRLGKTSCLNDLRKHLDGGKAIHRRDIIPWHETMSCAPPPLSPDSGQAHCRISVALTARA